MAHRGRVLGWGVAVALLAFGIAGPSAAFANDGSAGESDTVTNPQLPIAETPTPDPTAPEDPALEPPASETPAPGVPGSEESESDPEPTATPVPVDDAAATPPAVEVPAEETPAPAAAVAATDVAVVMTANGMEGHHSADW